MLPRQLALTMSNSCPCRLRHLPVMVRSRSDPLCHSPEQKEPNSISCTRHCSLLPLLRPCWWYLHAAGQQHRPVPRGASYCGVSSDRASYCEGRQRREF